jgi:hypothetical protein
MSGGTHGLAHDDDDIPKSGGIAPSMYLFLFVSLVIIFMQGYFVIASAGDGHIWPASDATKVALPEMKL